MKLKNFVINVVGVVLVIAVLWTVGMFINFLIASGEEHFRFEVRQTSETLSKAGAQDGTFIVIEYRYDDGGPNERVDSKTYFVISKDPSSNESSLMMLRGGSDWRLHVYGGEIVKVVNRDDPEWSDFADKFIRNEFWINNPGLRREMEMKKNAKAEK